VVKPTGNDRLVYTIYTVRVKLISICVRLYHYDHIMILPHQCPIRTYTYTVQSFIYFPDGRYVIILAVWRTIITNPSTTASSTTVSFSNSFSHSTLPECCVLGQFYEFHLVVNRYPIRTLLLYIACIGVWMYNCKTPAAP
jgi:hypothetical protein